MRSLRLLAGCALAILLLTGLTAGAATPVSAVTPAAASAKRAMYVIINGPQDILNAWPCTWHAQVLGGTPPYTYYWSSTGMVSMGDANLSSWSGYLDHYSWGGLSVYVTDAVGRYAWGNLIVENSNSIPMDC